MQYSNRSCLSPTLQVFNTLLVIKGVVYIGLIVLSFFVEFSVFDTTQDEARWREGREATPEESTQVASLYFYGSMAIGIASLTFGINGIVAASCRSIFNLLVNGILLFLLSVFEGVLCAVSGAYGVLPVESWELWAGVVSCFLTIITLFFTIGYHLELRRRTTDYA